MKALRMKALRERLEKISKEEGMDLKELEELGVDIDADWDPEKHDQQMAGLYEHGETNAKEDTDNSEDDGGEIERPTWEDDIDIGDIIPASEPSSSKKKKKKDKKKGKEAEDEQGEEGVDVDTMDADLVYGNDVGADEEWDGTEDMRKRKLDEYMEELYKLEFNDMIGDTPTRFHYVPVQPTSFALTPAEIILADDKDLNSYVSLRKLAPYRKGKAKSGWDSKRAERLREFRDGMREKKRIWRTGEERRHGERERTSVWKQRKDKRGEVEDGEGPKKKRKGKKERMKAKEQVQEI